MKGKATKIAAYLVSAFGVALHVYLTIVDSLTGSLYDIIILFMNALPYLACMIMTGMKARPMMPLCASFMILITDVYLFHEYLLSIRVYRSAVIEFYQTIFKTVVILPVGCFIGFLIDKWIRHVTAKTP